MLKTFRELLIVFIGVFAAFLLNDFRNNQIKQKATTDLYKIIYEDLNRYHTSGKSENPKGFIQLFSHFLEGTQEMVEKQELPVDLYIIGDYWNIELINSMFQSGKLNDIDSDIYKYLSRFHTVHANMLDQISSFNSFYENQVLPQLDDGPEAFYNPETKELKLKFQRLLDYEDTILSLAEATVGMAEDLKNQIQENHLKK